MDGLTLTGLSSGVATDAIAEKLIAAEGAKRTRMDWSQARVGASQTGLRSVQDKLLTLRNAAAALRDVGTWALGQTVSSSDDAYVSARRTGGAGIGGYDVSVQSLARGEQRTYDYTPPAADDSIVIGGVAIALSAGATIDDAVAKLNQTAASPVFAVNVSGKLVLSARTTGAASAFTATGSTLTEGADPPRLGADSTYTVDGKVGHSATNVATDAIAGVELTFKGVTAGSATVAVGPPAVDAGGVKAKAQAFVTAYNDLVTTARGLIGEDHVKDPQSASDYAQGALRGDSGLNSLLSQLRLVTGGTINSRSDQANPGVNPSALDELRELGISTGAASGGSSSDAAKAGLLSFDAATFDAMLSANPDGVRQLLGAAQKLEDVIGAQLGAGGVMAQGLSSGDSSAKQLQDSMTREDARLAAVQTRLKAQFAAMEAAMANAQNQQSWLTGQLNALNPG